MRIDSKPPVSPASGLDSVKQRLLATIRKPGFRSVTIAPYTLHRQGYSLSLTIFDGNGMVKDQLREPIETARTLFQVGKVDKIVIKRGAKPEDIAALFEQLNSKTLSLRDFKHSNIEIVFRPQPVAQDQIAAPQPAKPGLKETELAPPILQTGISRPEVDRLSFSFSYNNLELACETVAMAFHPARTVIFPALIEDGRKLALWIDYLVQGNGDNIRIEYKATANATREQLVMLIKALRETAQMIRQHPVMKAAAQPAKAPAPEVKSEPVPELEPEPIAAEMKVNSPAELLSIGKNLYKKGPARGSLPAVQKEAEKWLALAKAEVEKYKAQIGQGWTPELIAQRDTFCKLAKIINNFQLAIGPAPIEEVVIPECRTGYRGGIYEYRPQAATSTPAAPTRPAEPHRPSLTLGSRFQPGDLIDVAIANVNSMGAFTSVIKGVTGWIKDPVGLSKGQTIKAKVIGEEYQEASGQHYLILEHHDPDALPRPREGRLDDFRTNAAGINGKYVFIRVGGETNETGFLPDYFAHSSSLRHSEFVDTGAVLVHQYRSFKVYCTKEFLDTIAPLLLKEIADGQIFIFDDAHFLSPEEELVFAQQFIFGLYQPRGVMRSETFKSLREQYYNEAYGHFPFRLTIEGFSQKWTVRDLIRAMAQKQLEAVGVEKAETAAPAQPDKTKRPLSCDRLDYLRETCAKIFEIGHSPAPALGELNSPERKLHINACLVGEDIRPWLKHLNSGGTAALTAAYPDEYQYMLRNALNPDYYPSLIRKALDILNQVYEKI